MAYREDRDADQARIEALEGELALAKQQIAQLEGRKEQALVLASERANRGGNHQPASVAAKDVRRFVRQERVELVVRKFA